MKLLFDGYLMFPTFIIGKKGVDMGEVVTLLECIQHGLEDNIIDFTDNGTCSGCGNCCSNLLPMSKKEIAAIHRYISKYGIKECKHLLPVAKPAFDMTCPFRDNDNGTCAIYEVRPEICRKFICNNEKRAKNNRKLLRQTRIIVDVRSEFYGSSTNKVFTNQQNASYNVF